MEEDTGRKLYCNSSEPTMRYYFLTTTIFSNHKILKMWLKNMACKMPILFDMSK